MPRTLPDLIAPFDSTCSVAVGFPHSMEALAVRAKPAEYVARQLKASRIENAYEYAFLKLFMAWETLIEESFLRFMCDYGTPTWAPTLREPRQIDIPSARLRLLGHHRWISWYPEHTVQLSKEYFEHGRHQLVLESVFSRLEWITSVRHRVAHSSDYSWEQFRKATLSLDGARYRTPGEFLRSSVPSQYPRVTWLERLTGELRGIALQIVA